MTEREQIIEGLLDVVADLSPFAGDHEDWTKVHRAIKYLKGNGGWISVKDKLPPNADHPEEFCPRYQVMTKYGVTEGWYNPDKGCWYTLVWFLIGRYTEDDIEMERGDIPKISSKIEVTHWMPLPEPPKEEWNESVD